MPVKSINQSVKRRNNGQKHTRKNLDISQTQQKTTKVKTRFTEKIIHSFSNYALSEEEKQALSYSLDEHIPAKLNENKIQTEFD